MHLQRFGGLAAPYSQSAQSIILFLFVLFICLALWLSASQVKLTVVKSIVATDFEPPLTPTRTSFILVNIFIVLKINVMSIRNGRHV